MKLSIYAKNMTVSPNVTRRIERKTEKMSRYLLPDTEMQIRMRKAVSYTHLTLPTKA